MKPQDINWNPLFVWINEVLGTNVELSMDFSGMRPNIVSPNLFTGVGIFKAVFKKVTVDFFGFWEIKDENGEVVGFSANVNLWYEQWNGGTNGSNIGTVWFDSGKWKFESERVKFEIFSDFSRITKNPT